MYSVRMAYLFLAASLLGLNGLQRFYLGKFGSGLIYMFTLGLFGLGTLYDLFTLPEQVRDANTRRQRLGSSTNPVWFTAQESVELTILKIAKQNDGVVSISDVALQARVSTEAAQRELDRMVERGVAQMHVRSSGSLAYVILDFSSQRPADFEDI